MATYTVSHEGAEETFEANSADEARRYAREWADDVYGDYHRETIWADLWLACGDGKEQITAQIDPPEPLCLDDEGHDWQSPHSVVGGIKENPGAWGHGGGARISECCMRCGCRQVRDTWAQRPDTGEQGLESLAYDEDYYTADEL